MPFDLGNHPARLLPASGLIGEVRVRSAHVIGRATNRTLEQIADPLLKDAVRRKSNGVFDPFSLQIFVHLGIGEAGVGTKINARDFTLIPRHDRLQYCLPSVGAVNIARAQGAAFQIAKVVEHEQRMIAGEAKCPFQALISCSPCVGLTLESMSSTIPLGGRRSCTRPRHWPERSATTVKVVFAPSPLASK